MSLVELFCHVDDFCQAFEPLWILHRVCNDRGHMLNWERTPGNVNDRQPVVGLAHSVWHASNMKKQHLPSADQHLLHKRTLIETIIN